MLIGKDEWENKRQIIRWINQKVHLRSTTSNRGFILSETPRTAFSCVFIKIQTFFPNAKLLHLSFV